MKQPIKTLCLILFIFVLSAQAQSSSKTETIGQLAAALSEAFTARNLGSLDAGRRSVGKVKIVIEHSLGGDDSKDNFETKSFKTLAEAEKWLSSREVNPGQPNRNPSQVLTCRKGFCNYFENGILHNNLYLRKIAYGYINGRPYIKTIFLLDGD
jgi:hypothetical protein